MRRWLLVGLCLLALGGCGRPWEPAATPAEPEESRSGILLNMSDFF